MLIRGPVHSSRLARRASAKFSFQHDQEYASAYEVEEEVWDEEAPFDPDAPDGYEDDYQEDEYQESADDAAFASSDVYQSSYQDAESYDEDGPAFDEDGY